MGSTRRGGKVLRFAGRALQKTICCSERSASRCCQSLKDEQEIKELDQKVIPEDVKEGHFTVLAIGGDGDVKRFVVSLSCLSHPTFLRLLELAEEEFGFGHKGALAVPCYSGELEKILKEI